MNKYVIISLFIISDSFFSLPAGRHFGRRIKNIVRMHCQYMKTIFSMTVPILPYLITPLKASQDNHLSHKAVVRYKLKSIIHNSSMISSDVITLHSESLLS